MRGNKEGKNYANYVVNYNYTLRCRFHFQPQTTPLTLTVAKSGLPALSNLARYVISSRAISDITFQCDTG